MIENSNHLNGLFLKKTKTIENSIGYSILSNLSAQKIKDIH